MQTQTSIQEIQNFLHNQHLFLFSATELGLSNLELDGKLNISQWLWKNVLPIYSEKLSDCLREPNHPLHTDAWEELSQWVSKEILKRNTIYTTNQDVNDISQKILLSLINSEKFKTRSSSAPIFIYCLVKIKSIVIDEYRLESTVKRGENDKPERLDDVYEQATVQNLRPIEDITFKSIYQKQLRDFIASEIHNEYQYQVLILDVFGDIGAKDIATLINKPIHRVRQYKADAIQRLRNLPDSRKQQLHTILLESINHG